MKKAAIILNYISLGVAVVSALFSFVTVIVGLTGAIPVLDVFNLVSAIYSIATIVFAILINKAIKKARRKDELIVWAVLCIIFVNLIAGILMFTMSDIEFYGNYTSSSNTTQDKSHVTASKVVEAKVLDEDDVHGRLMELKKLFEDGIITEKEYQEKRQKYIEKL